MSKKPRHPETNTPTIRLGPGSDEPVELPPHLRLEPGDTVGHYEIISVVAEGGFGIVYLAEQHAPVRRRVALKIIKPGMDTRAVIARFEAERQALAILDHPGIAKVYDAGATDDGRPFFVMEYVEGDPVTDYFDEHRLTTIQRLEVMIDICAAIQHAHMKGIIHRDLKPSNILVLTDDDGNPQPKVIDFGVAKATSVELTEQSFCTESGQLIGTPEYMSPEQADLGSTDVDTRSDVYSLGMILYEAVSGALPFESIAMRQAGFSELCRIIQEDDPPKPSARLQSMGNEASRIATRRQTRPADLTTLLRRELDWIPLKALRKDREERYESAVALASDLQRYIEGDALIAGPMTLGYRFKKFLRRHRGGVLAAAIVFVAMLGGLNVSLLMYSRAVVSEKDAQVQVRNSERMRSELLQKEADLKEELAKTAEAEARAQKRAAEAEAAQADLQRMSYVSNLMTASMALNAGDEGDAIRMLRMAERGLGDAPPFEWRYLWAQAEDSLATLSDGQPRGIRAMAGAQPGDLLTFSPTAFSIWDERPRLTTTRPTPRRSVTTSGQIPSEIVLAPDRRVAVMTAINGQQDLIDTTTGQVVAMFPPSDTDPPIFGFSGDGRRFIRGTGPRSMTVHDSRTARKITDVELPPAISEVMLDRPGFRLAGIEQSTVHVLDVASGKAVVPPLRHDLDVTAVAFDDAGTLLATCTLDGDIRIWDLAVGRRLRSYSAPLRQIRGMRYGPNGDLLLVSSKQRGQALLDARNGDVRSLLPGPGDLDESWTRVAAEDGEGRLLLRGVEANATPTVLGTGSAAAVAFSRQGDQVVIADDDGSIRLWELDVDPPREVVVGRHRERVHHVEFIDDDELILVVAHDGPRIWPTSATPRVDRIPLGERPLVTATFTDQDATVIVGGEDGSIRVADLLTGDVVAGHPSHNGEVISLVASADGSRLISTSRDNTVRIWNLETLEPIQTFERSWWAETPARVNPEGTLLVLPDKDSKLLLIETADGSRRARLSGHASEVQRIAFDPNGLWLATADEAGDIRLWNPETGASQARLRGHRGPISSLHWKGGRLFSAGTDGTIRIWNPTTGEEDDNLQILAGGEIRELAFAPGDAIVAAGLADGSVRAWDIPSSERLMMHAGDGQPVERMMFDGRGDRLFAESENGRIRSWDTRSWDLGADLGPSPAGPTIRAVDPSGTRIASVAGPGLVRFFDALTGEPVFTLRTEAANLRLLRFTSGGDRLIGTDEGGQLWLWNTITPSQATLRRGGRDREVARLRGIVDRWIERSQGRPEDLAEILSDEMTGRPPAEQAIIRSLVRSGWPRPNP